MQIGRIANATRTLGGQQGYMVLPIRDDVVYCAVGGENTPRMTSAWFPTPKELELLNAGAPVYVRIVGTAHPPILVDVGPAPD